jgi:CubicO group peptidase (beta-lactamase class C family)
MASIRTALLLLLSLACAGPTSSPMTSPDGPPPTVPDDPTDPPDEPPPAGSTPCAADAAAHFAEIVTVLEGALSASSASGGAVAVVCGGRVAFVEAVGVRRRGGAEPVTVDTRFQWASSTKMLTGAAAAVLAEEGVVDLDAPLSTYLDFVGWGDITLHQLLTHTAGFPTEFDAHDEDLARLVRTNARMRMWAPPGAVWNYSNPGFSVAGRALEVAAGEAFAELVTSRVFQPAEMTATFDAAGVAAGDFAYGHSTDAWYSEPIAPDGAYFHTTYYGPMGGAWGSITDFAKWAAVHAATDGSTLSREALDRTRAPHTPTTTAGTSYGLGMFVEDALSPRVIHHGGSAPGFLANWRVVPEAGFGVAVLVNGDDVEIGEVVEIATDRFVSIDVLPLDVPEGPEAWAHYVGTYHDPVYFGRVEIAIESGALVARFRDRGDTRSPLTPWFGDSYDGELAGEWIDVNFWRSSPTEDASYLVSMFGVAARVE